MCYAYAVSCIDFKVENQLECCFIINRYLSENSANGLTATNKLTNSSAEGSNDWLLSV